MEHAKMELPNFIKINAIVWSESDNKFTRIKCRINPFHITSYSETYYKENDEVVMATSMYVGGTRYNLEMTVNEVDKMMDEIDRGVSIKE